MQQRTWYSSIVFALLLMCASATAGEADQVKEIEEDLRRVQRTMAEQDERVQALGQRLGDINTATALPSQDKPNPAGPTLPQGD